MRLRRHQLRQADQAGGVTMTWLPELVAPIFAGLGSMIFAAFGFDLGVAMFRRAQTSVTDDM